MGRFRGGITGRQAAELQAGEGFSENVRGDESTRAILAVAQTREPENPYAAFPAFEVRSFVLAAGEVGTWDLRAKNIDWFHVYHATDDSNPVFAVSLGQDAVTSEEVLCTSAGGTHRVTLPARDKSITVRNAGATTNTFTVLAFSDHFRGTGTDA